MAFPPGTPKIDFEPIDFEPIESEVQSQVQQPSALRSAWDAISQPLWEGPSRFASSVANYLDPAVQGPEDYSPLRSFGAGALEGIGQVVSGLTSPINIATTALTGGAGMAAKAGLPSIAKAAGIGARGAGALTTGHGAQQVLSPETSLSEKGFGLAEIAGGIAGMKTPISGKPVSKVNFTPIEKGVAEVPTPTVQPSKPLTYLVKKEKATPELVKKAKEQGYEFTGVNERGDFRFRKSPEPQVPQPILESEVGTTRPTPAMAREQLGPLADVKQSNPFLEAYNLPRGLMASIDFSAPLRQGLPLIHKKSYWTKALPEMFKSWSSEEGFQASQKAISDRPLFRKRAVADKLGETKELPSFAEEAGLKLTDLASDLSKREEALISTWAEKVPGVRRSQRAYTSFLNNLRANVFEELINQSKVFQPDTPINVPLARSLAEFVNTASGRGSLGALEKAAVPLNQGLFAPRLIASRIKMLNPMYYWAAPAPVRKEAIKSLFAIAATGNIIGQLGKMAGGEVSMDPSSSDFGKIKIGDTRIDPWGGFQQYIVAANRLLNPLGPATGFEGQTPFTRGQMRTSSTSGKEYSLWNPSPGPFDPNSATVAGDFIRGKVHPVLGFAWSLLSGMKEMTGDPMKFTAPNPFENSISQRFIPILIQDMYELAQDNQLPPEVKALVTTLSAFGMGQQTYGPKEN